MFGNTLVNQNPTRRGMPYGRIAGTATTIPASSSESAIVDPMTGLHMADITIPNGNTSYHAIEYEDMPSWDMGEDDIWFLSLYLAAPIADFEIQILVSDEAAIAGTRFRQFIVSSTYLREGFNIIPIPNKTTYVNNSTFGIVGNSYMNGWSEPDVVTDKSRIRSFHTRVRYTTNPGLETHVYLGSVHTAPKGWAKAAVMWFFDDVLQEFTDLAAPVIESYGWKYTIAPVATYSADPSTVYTSMDQVLDMSRKGHEVWSHSYAHDNFDTDTTQVKTASLKKAQDYFNAMGLQDAGKYIAWPFNAYDSESITIAKSLGYKAARIGTGVGLNPWAPGINAFTLTCALLETENPWRVDTQLKHTINCGVSQIFYGHRPFPGGEGIDAWPEAGKFYLDHFKRWCDYVAGQEDLGNCVVTTPKRWFEMCGVDLDTYKFHSGA